MCVIFTCLRHRYIYTQLWLNFAIANLYHLTMSSWTSKQSLRQLNPGGKPSTSSSKTSLRPLMVQRHSFISAQAPQACACLRRPATEPSQTSTFARLDDQLTSVSHQRLRTSARPPLSPRRTAAPSTCAQGHGRHHGWHGTTRPPRFRAEVHRPRLLDKDKHKKPPTQILF